jgi:hypothetical protein
MTRRVETLTQNTVLACQTTRITRQGESPLDPRQEEPSHHSRDEDPTYEEGNAEQEDEEIEEDWHNRASSRGRRDAREEYHQPENIVRGE